MIARMIESLDVLWRGVVCRVGGIVGIYVAAALVAH
jgi:hypothetical protein